ncbi:unnamed protein product [Spirodela intermedia]|uniref:Uncharacterized protein n=1 Tax=Spirodela intermedia TaxID=51605 RepID=A0A7I8KQB5_SPIIN|nr:unnamed protein product [Spirodela intermedia]
MKSWEVLAGEVQGLGRVAKKKQRKTKKGCQGAPVDFTAGEEWKAEDGEVEVQEEDGVGLPSAARRRREEAMKRREVLTGEEEGLGRLAKKRQKKTKKGCEGAAVGFMVGQELKAEDGEAEAEVEAEVDVEEGDAGALTGSVSDMCQSLMERYARSAAPQHRHLCASAAAMRSYLRDEGIPLTPPAYFAIAIAAVCDASSSDRETLSALSAFLSVLLPYVPPGSVPPHKAREAVSSLVALLENSTPESMAAPTVRSLVGSLGLLAQSVDLEDWSAVKLPLRVLLRFSVDRRPKVRRCAQLSVVKVFRTLKSSIIIGKASKVVFSLFQSYIPLAVKLCSVRHDSKSKKTLEKPENIEVLHVLNIIQHLVAHMSLKFIRKCLPDVCKLFNGKFSMLTRNIIGLLEVILQKLSVDVLEREAENVISVLTSYVSSNKKIPVDTICSASTLLKDTMNTLHHVQPGMWIKRFTLVFRSIAGLLISHPSIGKYCADILRELINMDFFSSNELCEDSTKSVEADIIISMCSSCENVLSTSSSVPNEHILPVISDLFLRLGKHSSLFMKEIVLKLSMWVASLAEGRIELQHVQQCLGSAIVSMGPESFLSIVSISFNAEKQTYSNMWLIPILKKYIVGASLQYFLEHVLPLSKPAEDICSEVRRSSTRKKLMAHVDALWSLLPAFCHYPTDTADHFDSLAKALIEKLKKDQSSHELVSVAIKELVNENKSQLELNVDQATGFMKTNFGQKAGCGPYYYPQNLAQKNIEVLASNSMELFKLFTDIFFDSPPEKRASLKDVIGCLASILGSLNLQNFFSSLLAKIELTNKYDNGRKLENHVQPSNDKMEEKRCLMIELASAFVDGADEDFIIIMFDYIKPHLSVDGIYQCEAFQTLSRILKVWRCTCCNVCYSNIFLI